MRFKATEEQVKNIMVNAINASIPIDMGALYFKMKEYKVSDIPDICLGRINVDYCDGRMVKLTIQERDGNWEIPNGHIMKPDREYQSWAKTYPTYKNLLIRSGVSEDDILD